MPTIAEQLRQEGRQEGRLEGRQEGVHEGFLKGIKEYLIEDLEARFSYLPSEIRAMIERIDNAETLKNLRKRLREVSSPEDMKAFLN